MARIKIEYDRRFRTHTVNLGPDTSPPTPVHKLLVNEVRVYGAAATVSDSVGGDIVIEVEFPSATCRPDKWQLSVKDRVLHVRPPEDRGREALDRLQGNPVRLIISFAYMDKITVNDSLPL